jgi:hypothetical protein
MALRDLLGKSSDGSDSAIYRGEKDILGCWGRIWLLCANAVWTPYPSVGVVRFWRSLWEKYSTVWLREAKL